MRSPNKSSAKDCISKLALASRPEIKSIAISSVSAKTIGRFDSVCGAMGTITHAFKEGCKRGPPADNEYAVLPVDVAMIKPSARWLATNRPSTSTRISTMPEVAPRLTTTSFMASASNTQWPSRQTLACISERLSSSNSPRNMGLRVASNP